MVDYTRAIQALNDAHADPVFLATIAYENPEFGAHVAIHPRAYPGLKRWIAQFGDEHAKIVSTRLEQAYGLQAAAQQIEQQDYSNNNSDSASNTVNNDDSNTAFSTLAPTTPIQQETPAASVVQPAEESAYHFTVEQALDPHTDQMTIAAIAQYAPHLRPYLARNPNTYPELLQWLANQHDPAIDAALAMRSATAAHTDTHTISTQPTQSIS